MRAGAGGALVRFIFQDLCAYRVRVGGAPVGCILLNICLVCGPGACGVQFAKFAVGVCAGGHFEVYFATCLLGACFCMGYLWVLFC